MMPLQCISRQAAVALTPNNAAKKMLQLIPEDQASDLHIQHVMVDVSESSISPGLRPGVTRVCRVW